MVSKRGASAGRMPPPAPGPKNWTVDYYVTADGSVPVRDWVKKLSEPKRAAWLAFVEFALIPKGKDIEQSGYVKALRDGLFELRIDHDATELAQVFGADLSAYPDLAGPEGPSILLRVFCTFHGDRVVLLLSGLDKGADPKAQPRAIRAARKLLAQWQAEEAAARRRGR
jgi:putative component of toxin-antitoxin plasmid stabilization module